MQSVVIVTDTATDIPPELAAELNLQLAPLEIIIDGVAYEDYTGLTREEFYRRLMAGSAVSTSGANIGTFLKVYERAKLTAKDIIVVAMPERLSVTTASARNAIELVEDAHITIVETDTAGAGLTALALWAARAARAGAGRDEILAGLEQRKELAVTWSATRSVQMVQVVLGRLSGDLQATAGYTLALLQVDKNGFYPFAGARDYEDAVRQMVDRMVATYGARPVHVATTHARAADEVAALVAEARRRLDCRSVDSFEAGPVSGGVMGLGLISIGACPAE